MATKAQKAKAAAVYDIERLAQVLLDQHVVSHYEKARVWAVKLYNHGVRVVEPNQNPEPEQEQPKPPTTKADDKPDEPAKPAVWKRSIEQRGE